MSHKRTASIQQLVGHIPDSVVYIDHDRELPYWKPGQGVIFFADISGFTSLTEKYTLNAKGGADQLTKTLNGYMGAIVDTILSGDGDILKYAGDAILCVWPAESRRDIPGAIARAVSVALNIQERYGEWNTDVGVKLKVKIGIAAGDYCITYLGNDEFRHYATTGKAVVDVNLAEKFCESGFVVVSPYAWSMLESSAFAHENMSDGKHVRVIEQLKQVTLCYGVSRSRSFTTAIREIAEKGIVEDVKPLLQDVEFANDDDGVVHKNSNNCRYRAAILEPKNDKLRDKLKLYIIRPVLKKIEDEQPLEYLSEMRQVTILFINMDIEENMEKEKQAQVLQKTFEIIYGICMNVNGCLNKVTTFDKGLTFLSVFGLPGFKHENDTQHALQSADVILKQCNMVDGCKETSVGVTTGATFCGVVGHRHRQEYTVIGRKVNMAARLMMYYPGKVTCDTDSFHHSKLPKSQFEELEAKEMKGLVNVGQIREFIGGGEVGLGYDNHQIRRFPYPMLGRVAEMQQTKTLIAKKCSGDLNMDVPKEILVIEGEAGTGKTRLLGNQIHYADVRGFLVISITCQIVNMRTPYYVVGHLLSNLLKIDPSQPQQEREAHLNGLFDEFSPEAKDSLYLLNNVLHLKYPKTENSTYSDDEEGLRAIIQKLVALVSSQIGFILFAIDDSHHMDDDSWDLIRVLGRHQLSLAILTKRRCKGMNGTLCGDCRKRLPEQNIVLIKLEGLEPECLASLACQMLGVVKIPKQLEDILIKKSNGVSSWCEQLLCEMLSDRVILIVPDDGRTEEMTIPPATDLKKRKIADTEMEEKEKPGVVKMCILNPDSKLDIGTFSAPESMKALIMARIDHLQETDQMCVKSAAVIGMEFKRVMLEAITPAKSTVRVRMAVRRLTVNGVFECASPRPEGATEEVTAVSGSIKCFCPTSDGKKKTMCSLLSCLFMRFVCSLMQETAYEILLEEQRRELHSRAAEYLETKAHKCKACGGGEFQSAQTRTEENTPDVDKRLSRRRSRRRKFSTYRTDSDHHSMKAATVTDRELLLTPDAMREFSNKSLPVNTSQRRASIREFLGIQTGHLRVTDDCDMGVILEEDDQDYFLQGVDLRSCECRKVLQQVFPELIRHWRAAGNVKKTLQFLYEAAAASLETRQSVGEVMRYLEEIERIIGAQKAGENPFEGEVSEFLEHHVTWEDEVRIAKLKGQAYLHAGSRKNGMKEFGRALAMMGHIQSEAKVSVIAGILKACFRQLVHRTFPERYLYITADCSSMTVEKIRCLLDKYHIHRDMHEKHESLLAALQQLNLAESESGDVNLLIQSYTCMIDCCVQFDWLKYCRTYKNIAMARLNESIDDLTPEDMKAVASLHSALLRAHMARGELIDACESGYNVDRISERLHDTQSETQILPLLFQTLIMLDRIINCMELLEQLQFLADERNDDVAMGWYYVSVMELLLTTGNKVVSVTRCIEFTKDIFNDPLYVDQSAIKFTLSSTLCLWCTRVADVEEAQEWYGRAEEFMPDYFDTFFAVSSYAKLVECQLLMLSQFITQSTEAEIKEADGNCWRMIVNLKKMTKRFRILIPRLLQLKAFYLAIKNQKTEARFALEACMTTSRNQLNSQEAKWAEHNMNNLDQVWYNEKVDHLQHDFWLKHWGCAHSDKEDDVHGATASGTTIKFTLPLPEWFTYGDDDDHQSVTSQEN